MGLKLTFVFGFEGMLRPWQLSPERVVDEMQGQGRVVAVAKFIEQFQGLDGFVKNAFSTLGIDVFGRVAWHRRNDFDLMIGEKSRQSILRRCKQYGEVATVDNMTTGRDSPQSIDEISEIRDHLRRASRNIDRGDIGACKPVYDPINCFPGHDLLSSGSCIHMAM